jgi:hypothetical protein
MPTHDSTPDQLQICESVLRNFVLLALPWLSFQRDILDIAKKSISNAGNVKPTENFTLRELQALLMIFDRSHEWRNLFDRDLEKRLEDAYKEIFPKVASASVQIIEAQEIILSSVFEAMKKLRADEKANHHPKSRH